ncbi:MAG: hypothetical protein FWC38_00580 [Proteobacteria bacterium]|nr:hypothetical protein [Pseudomonadota bacterium]MCL2306737.1 hypothetical protein [Pseudomonadota bacterium]
MKPYITRTVLRTSKGSVAPGSQIVLDDAAAAPLLAKWLIVVVEDKAAAPSELPPSPPAPLPQAGEGSKIEGDGGKLAALQAEVEAAAKALDEAHAALDAAAPNQKGVRTTAVNKAKERLAKAEAALEEARSGGNLPPA